VANVALRGALAARFGHPWWSVVAHPVAVCVAAAIALNSWRWYRAGTVRWRESVAVMAGAGVKTFYEVGAGKVLSGLIKRISEGASATVIGSPEDIAAYKAGRST